MGRKFYTVFFIPDDPAKVRRFRIPAVALGAAGVILAAFFTLYLSTTWSYFGLKQQSGRLDHYKELALSQGKELEQFTAKISELENRLERLGRLDKKLSSMLNLKRRRAKNSSAGQGSIAGGDESLEKRLLADKRALAERIGEQLAELELETRQREKGFAQLNHLVTRRGNILISLPSIMPTSGRKTSSFGPRRSPFSGRRSMHKGIDIANGLGTAVLAPGAGRVILAGRDKARGKVISLDHGFGIITRYGHLNRILVKRGQQVKRGQRIGTMGNTGMSTGTHLHYEVRVRGVPVNPERYVFK